MTISTTSSVNVTGPVGFELSTLPVGLPPVPVIGLPGYLFDTIHITALSSISTAMFVSSILLVYLCKFSRSVNAPPAASTETGTCISAASQTGDCRSDDDGRYLRNQPKLQKDPRPYRARDIDCSIEELRRVVFEKRTAAALSGRLSFWKWNVGERMVVYLAICDLFMCISHTMDHAYMLAARNNPPDVICTVFAFFLHQFIVSQWLMVFFYAVSACSLIVFRKKLRFGRWDWRLLLSAFGIPLLLGVVTSYMRILGPSGAW